MKTESGIIFGMILKNLSLTGHGLLTCSSPSHQPVEFFAKTTISCPGDKLSWFTVGVTVLLLVTARAISVDQTQTVDR